MLLRKQAAAQPKAVKPKPSVAEVEAERAARARQFDAVSGLTGRDDHEQRISRPHPKYVQVCKKLYQPRRLSRFRIYPVYPICVCDLISYLLPSCHPLTHPLALLGIDLHVQLNSVLPYLRPTALS